ncbi:hypothetical protein EPR50_G00012790 [Perca flavescens]|uniref:Fringe-like glycosyltransferase domain-containing protein n=1 Tax=Perca flavescens TaxID=8167 RepID=A0A484DJQ7_PERFV|nr:hypothetical protein EPR50_G00012790 [Perca flavescens]
MWKPAAGGSKGNFSSAAAAAVTCLLVTGMLVVTVGQPSSGDPAEPLVAAATSGNVYSTYFKKLTRERRAIISDPPRKSAPPGPVEHLSPADLFIAVKTTGRYHRQRLQLLLDTWISRNMQQTFVFTDGEDEGLRKSMGAHMINTNCSAAHNRQALSCKMALEYDTFINSGKKWFCHVDDDNYLNVGSLLKLLSQYSHTQDVYIGRPSLERPIEATERLGTTEMKQVTFWFATGGAGFCLSRGLALKMKPWASDGTFMATAEHIRLPDDCTVEPGASVRHTQPGDSQLRHSGKQQKHRQPERTIFKKMKILRGSGRSIVCCTQTLLGAPGPGDFNTDRPVEEENE